MSKKNPQWTYMNNLIEDILVELKRIADVLEEWQLGDFNVHVYGLRPESGKELKRIADALESSIMFKMSTGKKHESRVEGSAAEDRGSDSADGE